jgi:hypothetical protein
MKKRHLTELEMTQLDLCNMEIKNQELTRANLHLQHKLNTMEINQKIVNINNELNKAKTKLSDINAKIREEHGIDTERFSYNPMTGEIINDTKQDGEE